MRHRKSGRKLNRNASHRKAMFRNMACGLLHTLRETGEGMGGAKVSGRIVTTITKAKELRGYVERLVTFAKRAAKHADAATQFSTSAARGSAEWTEWRKSDRWRSWAKAVAPAIAFRRRAFSVLRDREAVRLLFDVVEPQCRDRNGGYTRVLRLAEFRLGDGGRKAIFEFVGFNGVEKARKFTPAVS